MPFKCSICEQESTQICEYCTKDTCADHLCTGCVRCSDCCECDVPLTEQSNGIPVAPDQTPAEFVPSPAEAAQQPVAEQDQAPEPEA
jgi:hypothetical protein